MNFKIPSRFIPPHFKTLINPFKPRSAHGGMNGIVQYNSKTDTFTKSVIGQNGLEEAKLAWQIASEWSETLQRHVPEIKSIRMDIAEKHKPIRQQHIQIEMSRAKGKPLSQYLKKPEIYNAVYEKVLEKMREIEVLFPNIRIGDRNPDNIFVVVEKGNIGKITMIDLDPAYFRGEEESAEAHLAKYHNRFKRMGIQCLKKIFNF
jgi:hypothetical protein